VWPHGGISQFRCNPHCGGGGDRFEGRMQDGTVNTESSHGRVGLVRSLPTGRHPELGIGVHALQSCSIYTYSRVLGHAQTL
jgi:hypothetical protein